MSFHVQKQGRSKRKTNRTRRLTPTMPEKVTAIFMKTQILSLRNTEHDSQETPPKKVRV